MVNLLTLPIGGTVSQSYQPQNHLLQNMPPYYNFNNSAFQKDSVKLSNKTFTSGLKKLSTTQKLLIGLGALTSAAALGIAAVRYRKTSALKDAQKVFQDVFMRNDITMTETKHMLQNYKNISKIKDKEEYIRAMFKEAKKNYGFENAPISLVYRELPDRAMIGGCDKLNMEILINSKIYRDEVLKAVHHEFRHAKQNYMAFHYNPEEYIVAMNQATSTYTNISNLQGLSVKEGIEWISEYMGKPNKANVPKECEKFAINSLKSISQTFNPERNLEAYLNSFHEKDAYAVGDSIEKIMKKFI